MSKHADWEMREAISYAVNTYGEHTYKVNEMTSLLYTALAEVPDGGLYLEIGTYTGCSASLLLHAANKKQGTVIMIDPFVWKLNDVDERTLQITLDKFKAIEYLLFRMTSEEAIE